MTTLTFDSLNPATGAVVGSHPKATPEAVHEAVGRAETAAAWWAALGHAERRRRLLDYKAVLTQHIRELAALVHEENGKPVGDATLELVLAVTHLDWAARNAAKVLGRRRVNTGMIGLNLAATLEYLPLGVVGVIGPWNYPVFTPPWAPSRTRSRPATPSCSSPAS
ncbi:aldehyde dehydrogenase family protein [Nonomuraea salmonea]|uniref:aldehyde dehydrogenase family protein n=1 Tax=Nonomuraea salmonea TaxID=46181 RepID=UPI002FE81962